jgi:hypothetical protein
LPWASSSIIAGLVDISIIFDGDYSGASFRTVWIVDTIANRAWFDEQVNHDAASAVFSVDRYPALEITGSASRWERQKSGASMMHIFDARCRATRR